MVDVTLLGHCLKLGPHGAHAGRVQVSEVRKRRQASRHRVAVLVLLPAWAQPGEAAEPPLPEVRAGTLQDQVGVVGQVQELQRDFAGEAIVF